ncbi:DUF3916 domain-containing protein [Bacillus altitudinis]|uniref:DUF3916 domain-containing protein n=1 Tax=Bacillus altitudinis TaxID=293387 RepID=UPI0020196CE9|nr:DUF3916 domain-containing protein [Bacillus altitudinis]MCL4097149.1 hypothetical protein [Bacillus altitudinis]UTV33525.1 DUF3916 domain-containing protein [Bacillus altitudinis]
MREKKIRGMKRNDGEIYRVVVAVDLPGLWHSQIIVFKGDSYVKDFFNRQDEYQTWLPLSDQRNIQKDWDLSVPQNMRTIGFKEVITDDDEVSYEGERWFMGELDDIK